MKKVISIILSFIFAISCMSVLSGFAAADNAFTVKFASPSSETSTEVTEWYKGENGEYYFFVPSCWDASGLTLLFNTDGVKLNGEAVTSGEVYDLGEKGTISCAGTDYKYNVISSAKIGSVFIKTESGSLDAVHADKNYKEKGEITVLNKKGEVEYAGDLDYIKGRGNQTWEYDKRPYNIKLGDKVKLLGMQKSAKWCLIANYDDAALIRNAIMYNAATEIGLYYSPECQPADVYINGEYKGSYLVTSKIEASGKRIDVENLDDVNEEICIDEYGEDFNMDTLEKGGVYGKYSGLLENTCKYVKIPESEKNTTDGGYILELELANRYAAEISGFVTSRGQPVIMKCPEYGTEDQIKFISDYFGRFEDAVFSETGKNEKGESITDLADITSLAKYYMISEWASNMDSGLTSTYFYLDTTKDGKLYAGPVWDYDIAMGNNNDTRYGCNYSKPNELTVCYGRQYRNTVFGSLDVDEKPTIFNQLCKNADFIAECRTIWADIYPILNVWAEEGIDDLASTVRASAIMNHIRWNTYGTLDAEEIGKKYDSDVNALKSFVVTRTSFLNINNFTIESREEKTNFFSNLGKKILTWVNNIFEKFIVLFHLENKI